MSSCNYSKHAVGNGLSKYHQLKSYVALSPAWNWRRAVLSADAGLLVQTKRSPKNGSPYAIRP